YKKLETRVSRRLARMQGNLGRRFNELLNPRGKEPKWEEWLETLESLLSRMKSLKMKETENSRIWVIFLEDKLEAHGNVTAIQWLISYRGDHEKEIDEGSLNFRTVLAALRRTLGSRKGGSKPIYKRGFATYGGEAGTHGQEDAPESEGETTKPQHLPRRRGGGGKRRFSQRDSFSSSMSPIKGQCAACGS
ncbi:hypothetical protein ACJ73_03850, partial [Blastomyces percursus]